MSEKPPPNQNLSPPVAGPPDTGAELRHGLPPNPLGNIVSDTAEAPTVLGAGPAWVDLHTSDVLTGRAARGQH